MGISKEMTVAINAFPGDKVWVRNYRRDGYQEFGKVIETTVNVDNSVRYSVKYRIQLERKSKTGRPLFLYVGNDGIL
jgi:hypothetical protein